MDRDRRPAAGDRPAAAGQVGREKLEFAAVGEDAIEDFEDLVLDDDIPDQRLRLMFTCCHPAIARRDAVALTLRTVAGLTIRQIAAAFLVQEPTMQARITRAKARIRRAGIPYRVPDHHELPERLTAVVDVLTLVYNQGYTPAGDPAIVDSLRQDAIGLAGVLSHHLPDEPEALGLHALFLFHEVRAPARVDADGELVALDDQDRSRWRHELIAPADELLQRALRLGRAGPVQLQAAISAVHSTSPSPQDTDWAQIVGLYDHLLTVAPSPTTEIGRAIAVGLAFGPAAGLAALPASEPPLDTFHRYHAARGDLLRRAGGGVDAAAAFERAIAFATNPAELRWLERQLRRCVAATPTP